MSDWQWFEQYEREALARGDLRRGRLLQIHREAFACRETAPDRTLALFAEGRRLSKRLREPWWVLLYEHWQVHGLLYYKWDYNEVLGPAARNTLTASKPEYATFPQRLRIYGDLTTAYLGIDPLGYAEQVAKTLDYLESQLPPEVDAPHYMTLEQRIWLLLAQGQSDEARQLCLRSLAQAEADRRRHTAGHYVVEAYLRLCQVASRQENWPALEGWAAAGLEAARQANHERPTTCLLLWQALSALQAGNKAAARRWFRNGVARMKRLRSPAFGGYYEALCAYYLRTDQVQEALTAREQELEGIRGRGMLAYESWLLYERCVLLARLGRVGEGDLEAARAAARRLRFPENRLQEIEKIEESS
jgi:hypothetical protein